MAYRRHASGGGLMMRLAMLRPLLLTAPAALVFLAFLLAPLFGTAMLSLHGFSMYTGIDGSYSAANYADLLGDEYFYGVFARTMRIAVLTTLVTVLIGAPEAYIINRMRAPWRGIFLLVALGPLLISVVSRTLGWAVLFGSTGVINQVMLALGLISQPVAFMYTELGVVIALTHVLVPFMVISVMVSLQRLNPQIEQASYSLGSGTLRTLRRVILPQLLPGILSGAIIVFTLASSAFATPQIVGGRRLKVIATLAYDEFLNTLNWPLGAAAAMILFVVVIAIVMLSNHLVERRYSRTL
jgi:putative spermidine/putrescine transport system permease protein